MGLRNWSEGTPTTTLGEINDKLGEFADQLAEDRGGRILGMVSMIHGEGFDTNGNLAVFDDGQRPMEEMDAFVKVAVESYFAGRGITINFIDLEQN